MDFDNDCGSGDDCDESPEPYSNDLEEWERNEVHRDLVQENYDEMPLGEDLNLENEDSAAGADDETPIGHDHEGYEPLDE